MTAPLLKPAPVDPAGFRQLYERHFSSVWRMVRRLGVHPSQLDDAVHDVFVVAWRRQDHFEQRSSARTWLLGIAVRAASDYRRRKQRVLEPLPSDLVAPHDPEAQASQAEATRRLHALLERLRPERREVFVLAELEQFSAPEIAEALQVNVNTVYTRLRAARHDFEALLAASEDSHE